MSSAKDKEEKEAKAKIKKDQEKREMAQALEVSLGLSRPSKRGLESIPNTAGWGISTTRGGKLFLRVG